MNLQALTDILSDAHVVELGQVLQENIPVWFTHPRFMLKSWESKAFGAMANHSFIGMGEHNGTHMDSTYHYFNREDGGRTIDELPTDAICGPCVVLHFPGLKAGEVIEKQQILDWEEAHGPIRQGEIVLIDFDWAKLFKPLPEGQAFIDGWPGLGKSAAEYLAEKKIKAVGVDPCAADCSGADNDPAHHCLLGQGILIIECLANLDQLPDRAFFVALPLRVKGGSGSPLRPIAIY